MADSSVAGSWTSPRTGVPAPRYLAGFLVIAATSWPASSRATHNRRPTKPDAPATSTFTEPPEPSVVRPALRPGRTPPVTRTHPAYPQARSSCTRSPETEAGPGPRATARPARPQNIDQDGSAQERQAHCVTIAAHGRRARSADMHRHRVDSDQMAGRPDLGILRVREPVGKDG